jgi:hypothetical protein
LFSADASPPVPFTNPRTCIAKRLAKLQAALERFEVESLTDLQKKSLGFCGNEE